MTRKTFNRLVCIVLTTGMLALPWMSRAYAEETAKVEAEKNSPKVFASVDMKNRYVGGGGGTVVDNSVTQTTVGIDFGNFSVGLWGNYDNQERELTEIDLFGGVPIETENLRINLEAGIFAYPNSTYNEDGEIGMRLSPKDLPLDLSVYAGQAFTDGLSRSAGRILELNVGKTLPLGRRVTFTPSLNLIAQNRYFGKETGFSHWKAGGRLNVPLNNNFGLSVHAEYQHPIDEKRFPNIENTWVTGIGLSFSH